MAITILRSEAGSEVSPELAGIGGAHGGSANFIVGQYTDDGARTRRGVNAGGVQTNDEARRRMERILSKHGERVQTFMQPTTQQFVPQPPPPIMPEPRTIVKTAAVKGKKGGKKSKAAKTPEVVQALAQETPHVQFEYVMPPTDNTPLPPYAVKYGAAPVQPTYTPTPPTLQSLTRKVVVFTLEIGTIKASVDAILESENGIALVYPNGNEVSFTPNQGDDLSVRLPDGRTLNIMYIGSFNWYNTTQHIMTFVKSEVNNAN
jgi:hypothetical protein